MTMQPLSSLSTKAKLARALSGLERPVIEPSDHEFLEAAWWQPRAHVVGLTGPPGVGKSTLASALVRAWRKDRQRVAVIAVDPSSRRSGGALLGDRTRICSDPEDPDLFIRSMAARTRLGGLATPVFPTLVLLRALFDRILIETVGVGQSETEIEDVADTILLAIQPASGDSLQLIKAGVAEIPHIAVVTKADLGPLADSALKDLLPILRGRKNGSGWQPEGFRISADTGENVGHLVQRIDAHLAHLEKEGDQARLRHEKACKWLRSHIQNELGRQGLIRFSKALEAARLDMSKSPIAHLAAFFP